MAANPISLILKQHRNLCELTPDQVIKKLKDRGISISVKALYAYECGTNLPKVPVFLALCDIYNIRDIMGSFGYNDSNSLPSYTVPLCVGDSEWAPDQYEDFFKVSLYEKIYLLAWWGIPSFEGYESLMTQPSQIILSDEEISLLKMYRTINSDSQGRIRNVLEYEYTQLSGKATVPVAKKA